MKNEIFDENMPHGKLTRVENFLPPPSELIMPEQPVKVTMILNKPIVDFFKQQAHRHHTKYQRMIREVLGQYMNQYKDPKAA